MSPRVSRRALLRSVAVASGAWTIASCRTRRAPPGRTAVTLWYSYGGQVRETLLALVDRFNASQSKHWVEATYQGDYFESLAKLRTALAAGVAPALTHVVAEVVPYLAAADVLEPLDTRPGATSLSFVTALAQQGSYVGGGTHPLVAIPFNRSTPIMYIHRTLFERRGLVPPTTWDEMRTAALALTDRAGPVTRYGLQIPISWWFWVALLEQAGGSVADDQGRITLGDEAGVRATEFLQRLVHDDRCMRPPPGRDYDAWQAAHQAFLSEQTPMIWSSTAFAHYLGDNARFPVLACPLPRDQRFAVPTGGSFFVLIREADPHAKDGAWTFVDWMSQPGPSAYWSSHTGYLPVVTGARDEMVASGYYAAHPNDDVAYRQLSSAVPWPWSRDLFRVQRDIVEPSLERAVLTRSSARSMLADAREALQESP